MFVRTLFAVLMTVAVCQAASAQSSNLPPEAQFWSQYDGFMDYRVQVRPRAINGYAVYYNTHAPIVNIHQINHRITVFNNRNEANEFLNANPDYEAYARHYTSTLPDSIWITVDTKGTYASAWNKESELIDENGYRVETKIEPFYAPYTIQSYTYQSAFGW